ncbi:hypothetical protein V9L20_03695 [Variovorax sp. CCNWLW225]|uniref:hypothetical protein n=1 Tax=Variovorax sp. CCNWLW225 TaxID=3127462 RepID=UPI003077C187
MALSRVNDKVYKGELYVDLLTDEDYFGLGLCRWSMPFANFSLRIGNLVFGHSIALNDILAHKSATRYFSTLSYRESTPLKVGEPFNRQPVLQPAHQREHQGAAAEQ